MAFRFLPLILVAACAAPRATVAPDARPAPVDPPHAQHAAPGTDPARHRVLTDAQGRRFTTADVQFMQHMIWHHAQALTMTSLVDVRTSRADLRALAERIGVSQRDEIASMRQWLLDRGQEAPDPSHAGHAGAATHAGMPGMLREEEIARLAAARGAAFDRLFLESMIRHHEGAITMVKQLFSSPASGQDSQLFAFATDVEADQASEIARMRRLLAGSATGTGGG